VASSASSITFHDGGVYGNVSSKRPRQPREAGSYFGNQIQQDPSISTGSPRTWPVIAVVPNLTDAAQATILEVIGGHVPGKGLLGQSVSAVVMEAASVISGHVDNHPFNVTLTVAHGSVVVLASPFAKGSPILSIEADIDMFVDSSQLHDLFDQNFRSFVFKVNANQSISWRGGTFYAIIALSDTGAFLTPSTVQVNVLRGLFTKGLLTMNLRWIVILL
jgi:hypothetical protein